MPNLSRHFNLSPADIRGMTLTEWGVYQDALGQLRGAADEEGAAYG